MMVFSNASMAKPNTGLVNGSTNKDVSMLVHSQLRPKRARMTTATGNNCFDKGITPTFHLMKAIKRMK